MELEKFARQLRLMVLLTQNHTLTVDEIGRKIGISRRTIYRYLDAFQSMGFIVKKQGTKYCIDASSPFFQKVAKGITFSDDEALTISQVLNSVYDNSLQVRHLREKLSHLYNTNVLSKYGTDDGYARKVSLLYQAISEHRVVVLRNYNSPSGGSVENRIVEPYLFMGQNSEVRCYEIPTKTNKTFKVSRCESVELVDLLWSNEADHTPFFNDLFGFTGETRKKVSLLLGNLSTNILLEEYPDASRELTLLPDGRHRFDTEVCSYLGIGRFVTGLYEDIQIIDSPEFEAYIRERIARMVATD